MVDVTVDNTPVSVVLNRGESFSPSAGNTLRVEVTASKDGVCNIGNGSSTVFDAIAGDTSNADSSVSVVLTDDKTVTADGGGAFISGFVL